MRRSLIVALTIVLASPSVLAADNDARRTRESEAKPASAALTEGEVRRVDKESNKITIRHGPIRNLDMPAMTMVFRVKDPALLEQIKAGDKVTFRAEKVDGVYTVTRIEPAR